MSSPVGTIYLLHFDRPYHHAKHYMGFTERDDVQERIQEHLTGQGANLMRYVTDAGIGVTLARTWENVTRHDERRLKNRGTHCRVCPICRGEQ